MALSAAVRASCWLVLAVPLVAGVELATHLLDARQLPSDDDWARLSQALPPLFRREMPIIVAPRWLEVSTRTRVDEHLFPLSTLARAGETSLPGALEVSYRGARDPALGNWKIEREIALGSFTLRQLRNPAWAETRYDFTDAVARSEARVAEVIAGNPSPCNWSDDAQRFSGGLGGPPAFPNRRFLCPSHDFVFVGTTVIDDESYRARRCIWAHPPPRGVLELSFDRVQLGTSIEGHMGIPWLPARDGVGTPVLLEVLIDGREAFRTRYDEREGWKRFELNTGTFAPTPHRVVWRISSERFDDRHFCFEAQAK